MAYTSDQMREFVVSAYAQTSVFALYGGSLPKRWFHASHEAPELPFKQ